MADGVATVGGGGAVRGESISKNRPWHHKYKPPKQIL